MRTRWKIIEKYSPWLLILLTMDIFFCILLWIVDIQSFLILSAVLLLGSLVLFAAVCFVIVSREMKRRTAFEKYVHTPNEFNEETLLNLCSRADENMIRFVGETLRNQQQEKEQLQVRTSDYEEYVEQMLFYARLKVEKKDYLLEFIDVSECVNDILADYKPLLEENHFQVKNLVSDRQGDSDLQVYSDRRGLRFILSQVISNALKYSQEERTPELIVCCERQENENVLSIRDNGIGVRISDLAYIFEKGFTGDTKQHRKQATGMGLYLAKEMAEDLKISLEAKSKWKQGFEMKVRFPIVEKEEKHVI